MRSRFLPARRLLVPAMFLTLFLAACAPSGAPDGAAVDGPETTEPATPQPARTTPPTEAPTAAPSPVRQPAEQPTPSDDDRSSRLQAVTAGWGTDWTLRTISTDELLSGGPPRDGIPPLDDPTFVSPGEADEWLAGNEPVVVYEHDGDARAYPLQVLTWHEIVNDTVGGRPVAITFCPLCNSAIAFDRTIPGADGGVTTFGTSGLLRFSDLVMWDRTTESLWQQFTGEGIVGVHAGKRLTILPSAIISFEEFRAAHPEGAVLSRDTGHNRPYGQNPYVGYDTIGQNPFLFTGVVDGRLPAMARVVTVYLEDVDAAAAYPLETLAKRGVIHDSLAGVDLVVFHTPGTASALGARAIVDGADVGATGVFSPWLDGERLSFGTEDGAIRDDETNSTWNVLGQAVDGPLAGKALSPIVHADHFWFSWAAFRPDTIIYEP